MTSGKGTSMERAKRAVVFQQGGGQGEMKAVQVEQRSFLETEHFRPSA